MVSSILDLIPFGSENAISRNELTRLCDDFGLIEGNTADKDRAMRNLMRKAKLNAVILSKKDGGYFKPDIRHTEDVVQLREYIQRERKRAKSVFLGIKRATSLLEDVDHERFKEFGYNPYQE